MRSADRYLVLFCLPLILSCQKAESSDPSIGNVADTPPHFPMVQEPEDNEFTQARWQLGKKLFFDPVMSVDSSISCATCHKPELAFTDNLAMTPGVEGRQGTRNVPSLANVAYHPYYTREGGVPTLEMQVLVPIQEHNEFGFNIIEISERLLKIPEYVDMSINAYGRVPDYFVITRAISCFERTLISGNSRYDQYFLGKKEVFSDQEVKGMNLFFSDRLSCSACHGGFDFTDYEFKNNGIHEVYDDPGRFRFTGDAKDVHLFKTPSLRNVSMTKPYMHDGSMATLGEVVDHYNKGGKGHDQQDNLIRPLNLTEEEKRALIAFLETLTDQSFITNEKFN